MIDNSKNSANSFNRAFKNALGALTEVHYRNSASVTFKGKGTAHDPLELTVSGVGGGGGGSVAFADITGNASDNANLSVYISQQIASLVASAPSALNTLDELAAALGDDANFATTVTNSLATKASLTAANTFSNQQIWAYQGEHRVRPTSGTADYIGVRFEDFSNTGLGRIVQHTGTGNILLETHPTGGSPEITIDYTTRQVQIGVGGLSVAGTADFTSLKVAGTSAPGYVLVDAAGDGIGVWQSISLPIPDGDYGDVVVTASGTTWNLSAAVKTELWSDTATLTGKTMDGASNTFTNIPLTALDTDDLEALDPDLAAIAALTPAQNDFIVRGASAWEKKTVSEVKTILNYVKADIGLGSVANADTTNASNISSGTLADVRLSSNVPLKDAANIFTAAQVVGPTSALSSGSLFIQTIGGTVNHSGTAASTSQLISTYIQAEGSGGTYLIDAGTRSAAYPSGSHSSKFNVWANGLVNASQGFTMADQASTPSVIPAASTAIFSKTLRGRQYLAAVNNSFSYFIQRSFASGNFGIMLWQGATGTTSLGLRGGTPSGTATGVNPSPTGTVYTKLNRTSYVSSSTAGSGAGTAADIRRWWLSSTAGEGGFNFTYLFGDQTAIANQRGLTGLWGTDGFPSNVDPSTLTNFVGMAYDAGGTTWKIMHNDASGTCTIIDLGANFPVAANTGYILNLYCAPGVINSITYYVERLGTAFTATGTLTTNLPAENARLGWLRWINNGTTASAATCEISMLVMEQEGTNMLGF
jgi:hypothetical protein